MRIPFLAAVCFVLALAGCEYEGTPVVSLDEAIDVTAEFSTPSFVPPKRSISDIRKQAATLYVSKVPCDERRRWRDLKGGQLATDIRPGRGNQANLDYARQVISFAQDEMARGNFRNAEEALSKATGRLGSGQTGTKLRLLVELVRAKASIGETFTASSTLSELGSITAELRGKRPDGRTWEEMRKVHTSIGRASIAQAEGSLREAEINYRHAAENAPHAGYLDGLPDLRSDLAENLIQQGRAVEAEIEAREAVDYSMWRFGYSGQLARSLIQLAEGLLEQERIEDAEYLARLAIVTHEIDCSSPVSLSLLHAQEILARSLALKGDWDAVLAQFKAAETALAKDPGTLRRVFGTNVDWPMALIRAGQPREALGRLADAIEAARQRHGPNSYAVAELVGIRAVAHHGVGDTVSAIEDFQAAIPVVIESGRGQQGKKGQFTRDFHIRQILEGYLLFLKESSEVQEGSGRQDAVLEAFHVASALGGRGVERALAAHAARGAASDATLRDLVRREQDAAQRISAAAEIIANLNAAPEDQYDASLIPQLQQRLNDLRSARSAILKEIETRFPDYADIISPKPVTVARVRQDLRSDEVLISAYVGEDRTFVWAFGKDGPVSFASSPIGYAKLSDMVASLRASLDPQVEALGEIPRFDVKTAYALYEALLKPVEAGWKSAQNILFVPHGPLGFLPLSVLPTEPVELGPEREPLFSEHADIPWLAKTHAVTTLPSALALKLLRGVPTPPRDRQPVVAFADPVFAPGQETAQLTTHGMATRGGNVFHFRSLPKTRSAASADISVLPPLPDTAEEVRSLALTLNADLTQSVFLGTAANEEQVKTKDLSGYKVVAFATHGLVPGDLDGLLQPALALSNPAVTGTGGDGLLTMDEIMGLKLDADWVVLSACNTGAAEGAGAEAMSGLGRAFFYAGTRALLVSNWPVETTSAKALTTDLFRRQAKDPSLGRAEALRQAMLALMESGFVDPNTGKMVFSYAHPIFWAPFSLVGDGGGGARAGS